MGLGPSPVTERPLLLSSLRTIVYVDGYNFYYSCCKGTAYRWINLKLLSEAVLGEPYIVSKVYYFTARVKSPPWDPGKRQRQFLYWRALRTVSEIEIVEGHYQEPKRVMLKVEYRWKRSLKNWLCRWPRLRRYMVPPHVRVIKAEEKRSDVNLSTQLLLDAFDNSFDCAAVVSNDSDLVQPIRRVRTKFGKCVGLICARDRPSKDLNGHVDFFRYINPPMLKAALFPEAMSDPEGPFSMPSEWR